MLIKLKFNNLVISNKKGIQQARIQTINKLVHKIRKLETQLQKQPDNTKCKERVRKSTETLTLLKKLKRVDIMKKVLLLEKPPAAVITNGLSTPEEAGVALLKMNKVMDGLIKKFTKELQLSQEENSDWKQVLMESSKRRQKIQRTEDKRRKRLQQKQQKALGRRRLEWLEENQQNNETENVEAEEELNISTTGGWQVEELSNDDNVDKTKDNIESNTKNPVRRTVEDKPLNQKLANKKPKLIVENEETTNFSENNESEEESESDIRIKPEEHLLSINSPQESDEEPEVEYVVDQFFTDYLSTADQENAKENNDEKGDLHVKINNFDKKPIDFRERRQQNRNNNRRDFDHNKNQNNQWSNGQQREQQNKWNNRQSNDRNNFSNNRWDDNKTSQKKEQDFMHNKSLGKGDEEKLHPSWAAKQKFKPVITGFQGKKITFGDDDNLEKPVQRQQQTQHNTAILKNSKTDQDSLHPSWAAKQKLKPIITDFQGKKITFNTDD